MRAPQFRSRWRRWRPPRSGNWISWVLRPSTTPCESQLGTAHRRLGRTVKCADRRCDPRWRRALDPAGQGRLVAAIIVGDKAVVRDPFEPPGRADELRLED